MSDYKLIDDLPSSRDSRLTLDEYSNYYLKDSRIPDSYVITETLSQSKESYEPNPAGREHPSKRNFFLFEEKVTDIGGGLFKISANYAKTPDPWYGFESIQLPYLKFWGLSVIGGGGITIGTSYLSSFLNVQSTDDLFFFNTEGFTDSKTKSGTINVACRVKYDYDIVDLSQKTGGNIEIPFEVGGSNSFGDGAYNCGYFGNDRNPIKNANIDEQVSFAFSIGNPSPKVKIESGVYLGNIYYRKTYQIIGNITI